MKTVYRSTYISITSVYKYNKTLILPQYFYKDKVSASFLTRIYSENYLKQKWKYKKLHCNQPD